MKGDHSFRRKPRGATGGGYARPRVQIGFEPVMLKKIAGLAKSDRRSFAAEVRELLREAIAHRMASDGQ